MIIECGPKLDKRILNFQLPKYANVSKDYEKLYLRKENLKKNYNVAVLVSGGIDSALLYYLLLLNNKNKFNIVPYTILRREGSKYYAKGVINLINSWFNLSPTELNVVGDNTIEEYLQVKSGIDAVLLNNDFVYLGIIDPRPEHSIGWERARFNNTLRIRSPFIDLQKVHIIHLIYLFKIEKILEYTHSCAVNEIVPCEQCNGCREKAWGLNVYNEEIRKSSL